MRTQGALPRALRTTLAIAPFLLAGCAVAAEPDARPAPADGESPIVSLGASKPLPAQVRAAMLWYPSRLLLEPQPTFTCTDGAGLDSSFVAQELKVKLMDPVKFTLDVRQLPPDEALVPLQDGGAGRWTAGVLVIYRDGNHNKRLDPSSPGAPSADEVLGASSTYDSLLGPKPNATSYVIYYSERRQPQYGPVIEQGYNLYRDETNSLGSATRRAVPLDTEITIDLTSEQRVQLLSCEGVCFNRDPAFSCPASAADLPEGGEMKCIPASGQFWAAYSWAKYVCDGCSCTVYGECSDALDPSLPVPADWPCPSGPPDTCATTSAHP